MIYAKQIPPKPVVGGGSGFVYVTVDTGQSPQQFQRRIRIIGEDNTRHRILRYWGASLDYYSAETILTPSTLGPLQIYNGTTYVSTGLLINFLDSGNLIKPEGEAFIPFFGYDIVEGPTYYYPPSGNGLLFLQIEFEYV